MAFAVGCDAKKLEAAAYRRSLPVYLICLPPTLYP